MSVTVPSKNYATTFLNSEVSSILSPIKNKITRSKISEVLNTSLLNSLISTPDFILSENAPQDTQFSFPPSINNPEESSINNPKESSCSSQNSSHSLVQTITSVTSFEGRFSSPNSVADQNKTHSIFDKVGEEETKLQEEPRYFCKDKDIYMFLRFK